MEAFLRSAMRRHYHFAEYRVGFACARSPTGLLCAAGRGLLCLYQVPKISHYVLFVAAAKRRNEVRQRKKGMFGCPD